jgi:hypothetical protein
MSEETLSDLLDRSVTHLSLSDPPIADLLQRGRMARRRRRSAAVVGAALAMVVVVGGGVAVGQRVTRPEPTATRNTAEQPTTGQPALPAAPTGMKWVGVGRTVVAVPRDWPVVPGVYCQGPSGRYVTITQPRVVVGCLPISPPVPPVGSRSRYRSSLDMPSIDLQGSASGGFAAQVTWPSALSGLTQRSVDASRTRLPDGWLTIPSGEEYGGAGPPTLTSEIAALRAGGFHVVRRRAAATDRWRAVTTDPAIGTPARIGSTVVVYDHGSVASSATLSGQLRWVGGPAPGTAVPHPGTVHVVDRDDSVDQTVRAGDDGHWRIYLPPGTYRVRATSPGYLTRLGSYDTCAATHLVTLGAGGKATVQVLCQLG